MKKQHVGRGFRIGNTKQRNTSSSGSHTTITHRGEAYHLGDED
jgi:hypothetical protein